MEEKIEDFKAEFLHGFDLYCSALAQRHCAHVDKITIYRTGEEGPHLKISLVVFEPLS